jgi:predicted transposase/invertase (TIGR01784 family)
MKPIEELTFTDDYMFGYVMRNPEICKGLLERLLKIKIERLEYPELQKSISPYYESKGIRLDVYVKDSDKIYDIEIQNGKQTNLGKRTRYYQSMIDIDNLLKGANYNALNESYIIFICTFDPFGKGLSHYTLKTRCIQDSEVDIKDGVIKEIFNAKAYAKEQDVEISNFLKYIDSKEASDDFTDKINHLVENAKINEKFRSKYLAVNIRETDIYEEGRNDGLAQGISQGAEQAKIETAKNLLAMKLPLDSIAKATGLTLESVQNLAKEQNAENFQR